jgi:hypothetical protein
MNIVFNFKKINGRRLDFPRLDFPRPLDDNIFLFNNFTLSGYKTLESFIWEYYINNYEHLTQATFWSFWNGSTL